MYVDSALSWLHRFDAICIQTNCSSSNKAYVGETLMGHLSNFSDDWIANFFGSATVVLSWRAFQLGRVYADSALSQLPCNNTMTET